MTGDKDRDVLIPKTGWSIWPLRFHRARPHFPGITLHWLNAPQTCCSCLQVCKPMKPFSPTGQDFLILFPFLGSGYITYRKPCPGAHSKRRWLVFRQNPRRTLGYTQINKSYCLHYVRGSKGKGSTLPHAVPSLPAA